MKNWNLMKKIFKTFGSEIDLNSGLLEKAQKINDFYRKYGSRNSVFNYSNPIKHFYDQANKM